VRPFPRREPTGTLEDEIHMAAINQPGGPALTVRDAAAACRLSPRTIRRKLTTGSFPNAYKTGANGPEREGIWMIPVADLEAAELEPTSVHPTLSQAIRPTTETELETDADADGPTVLELVRSDRFGRLRAELAEAVAAAEIALLRAEAERWRVLAEERGQALDRADVAINALTTAMGAMNAIGPPANAYAPPAALAAPAPSPVPAAPPQPVPMQAPHAVPMQSAPEAQPPAGDIVAVPPLVRAEAMRYTASLRALHEARKPQTKWWQFWKA
jgi:hypothetical protein